MSYFGIERLDQITIYAKTGVSLHLYVNTDVLSLIASNLEHPNTLNKLKNAYDSALGGATIISVGSIVYQPI